MYLTQSLHRNIQQRPNTIATSFQGRRQSFREFGQRVAKLAGALQNLGLQPGDGAYMDDEGFIFIVDRMKDMIVSGGENVYSAEVENAVAQHPDVAQCAVIGIPSDQWGEAVHAVVVPNPSTSPTAEDIRIHCHALIAGYKCPRSVEFRDALPLSGAGKILKTELRKPFWQDQERRVH